MTGRRAGLTAVALVVVGGLLLAGATSAAWVTEQRQRDVAGVELDRAETTPGIELAPNAVPCGVGALVGGLVLALARGRVRRVVGAVLVADGVAAGVTVGTGVVEAVGTDGRLAFPPALAGLGVVAILVGGAVAVRRPAAPPSLGPRYDIDSDEVEQGDDWRIASEDEPLA